jgi:hypothetical protein
MVESHLDVGGAIVFWNLAEWTHRANSPPTGRPSVSKPWCPILGQHRRPCDRR